MHPRRIAVAFIPLLLAALPVSAATFMVTRADDPLTPVCVEGNCSLRGAVAAAAITPEADLVLMPAGTFTLARSALNVSGGVTIRGAGSAATSIVGTSEDIRITGGALSDLVIEGLQFTKPEGEAIVVVDGHLVLRDVVMPNDANGVGVRATTLGASLLVEASRLPAVGCIADAPACTMTLRDSAITVTGVLGTQASLDARGIVSVGSGTSSGLIVFLSNGRVRVADSTFSNHTRPIDVNASIADVLVERTRFIGNTGPLRGQGGGMARLDDVEFSDNIVSNANITLPAVLHATDGTTWRINRALFDGNRGGGGGNTVGAVVAADPGANVVMTNTTFVDNTYRAGVSPMNAHAIGVVSTAAKPTIMWLFHATLRRAPSVPATTLGSLLSVSGAGSSVRLFNSVLDGTCLFGNGGGVLQSVGSIESIGNTCGIAGSGNYVNVPAGQLGLGALADNGGFTASSMPVAGSYVIGRADPLWCRFVGIDQRRHVRPADGIGCDVGAVERGALADTLFADGFD